MSHNLEQSVIDELNNQGQIKAIKRLRELRGIGLKEAKDIIDSYLAQGSDFNEASAPPINADYLEQAVVDDLKKKGKVAAIKTLRELRGVGLKDAKDIVDLFLAQHPHFQYAKTSTVNSTTIMIIVGLVLLLIYLFKSV